MAQDSESSAAQGEPDNLEGLLDQVCAAAESEADVVRLGDILKRIGTRSFGVLLLLPTIVCLTPIGGVPVLPTVMASLVILVAGQLVVGLDHFWLPQVLLRRGVAPDRLEKSAATARPVARFIDRLIRPRLQRLTREPFVHVAAVVCILVALTVPPLEIVPFGGTPSWLAIGFFGLALIARDGLLALVAFAFSLGAAWMLYTTVL